MITRDQELESLWHEFENREAGVADLMELYEKVEDVYVQAAASMSESEAVHTSNRGGRSTNMVKTDAYLGRDSSRAK